ncbi:hypothetical protein QUB63_30455 [Microcoleus sp. ARI1-B5]|uniref:hypothetical protein n=1 Tax=unclassified Microcoleus TaxID=2642155 RepID=UPI002FD253FD
MKNKIQALSDPSRTNQLKILETPEKVAEKLFQYLFKMGKGIEHFLLQYSRAEDGGTEDEDSKANFYNKRHIYIKKQIQERLSVDGKKPKFSDIQYFMSDVDGQKYVFFISSHRNHSGWKQLFSDRLSNRERILNLAFKFYILAQNLSVDTMNGFEELLFIHSKELTESKSKDALLVWGQNLLIKYNHHDVLTLTLSRKSRRFLPKDRYSTVDGDDVGELLVYEYKNYYFDRDRDARHKNKIDFMRFDKDDADFDKFKKTQLYHYQNLMTKLESFLKECAIAFEPLPFQADHYLKNHFIKDKNLESIESLEILNNTGIDLTESERQFLKNCLKHQGVSDLTFYNSGKTITNYEQVELEGEDDPCWKITEVVPWSSIELDKEKNYLVFNKLLEEEAGSMAYQRGDGFWNPSTQIYNKSKVDFYSQLKKKLNYLDTGEFFSTQGINIPEFRAVGYVKKAALSLFNYSKKIDINILNQDTQDFTDAELLDVDDAISCYLRKQEDKKEWEKFCEKYKIKISPQFQKVWLELGIKNWMRQSFVNSNLGLPITPQSFSEKQFFTIYVRSPRNKEAKAVAIEFLYKDGCIYIKNVMRDMEEIKKRFKFLKNRKKSENLLDNQQYLVDEAEQLYISCYTSDIYTPTLVGRNGILEELENGKLKVNRQIQGENSSKLLPLVSYYNGEVKPINRIQNMICLDLQNATFIQYYVPPAQAIDAIIKRGFRVYHAIGCKYSKEAIPTSELIEHPITALHFSTLTKNVLKISENSQSSLLQKVAKVLVEN